MPGLSVFYNWLVVPFFIGIWYLLKADKSLNFVKIIGLLLIITPISAALTGDFFYPLRTLDFLWVLILVISIGLFQIYLLIKSNLAKLILLVILLFYSFFSLYVSYFILFKYEKAENYGYAYMQLMDKLPEYNNKQIIIDLSRDLGIGIRIAYLKKYPPKQMQDQLRPQLKTPYYNDVINTDEIYEINNIELKPWDFGDACRNNVIIVGDRLTMSPEQMKAHSLKLEFQILDLSGKVVLFGYSTNPETGCIRK